MISSAAARARPGPETRCGKDDPLDLCPSAPHRAVARLLAMAMGAGSEDDRGADLAQTRPKDLAGIAAAHHVATVLASAFEARPELETLVPLDLVIFLTEMRAANERRNAQIRIQLLEIGRGAAERGFSLVALKGGADLLSPIHRQPGHRYISDLDLLVADADMESARSLLHDLGAWEAEIPAINMRDHYHLAPFLSDRWHAQVELHRALGPAELSRVLAPDDVLRHAGPSEAAGLHVPSAPHRLAHIVLHARKDAGKQHPLRVSLRDLLEFHAMAESMRPAEIRAASALLSTGAAREAFAVFEAMRCAVFAPRLWETLNDGTQDLGARALQTYGRPGVQMWREALHWFRHYAREIIGNPERRRHFLREATRSGGLGEWIAHHRDRWGRIR